MLLENYIFAILFKNQDYSYTFKGTGFIISKFGLFLSAAHVFREGNFNKERYFCTFPYIERRLYQIDFLKYLYTDIYYQKGPVYKDIAIGKINKKFDYFLTLNQTRPNHGNNQKIIGYRNIRRNPNIFDRESNKALNLTNIEFEQLDSEIVNRYSIISTNLADYESAEHLIDNNKKYNNCFTIRRAAHKGVSGGPVFNDNNTVSGMYFGGPETHRICHCLASRFLIKKLKMMTKHRFNRYKKRGEFKWESRSSNLRINQN